MIDQSVSYLFKLFQAYNEPFKLVLLLLRDKQSKLAENRQKMKETINSVFIKSQKINIIELYYYVTNKNKLPLSPLFKLN